MSASVIRAYLLAWFRVDETTGGAPSGVNSPSHFEDLDQLLDLSSPTTPNPTLFSVYKTAISSGGYTIDLTAAQGSNGNVDATGKKLLGVMIFNPAASAGFVQLATGGSNGYTIPHRSRSTPAALISSIRRPT